MEKKTKAAAVKSKAPPKSKAQAPKAKAAPKPKTQSAKSTAGDAEKVEAYMTALEHPLKAEIEAVRKIIRSVSDKISERIKWNAPSYYYKEDFVTFNPRATNHVHLVFHHPSIETIKSDLLEGDYIGRRMAYFTNMKEVKAKEKELVKVVRELLAVQD
jgi:uncharacterized protein YdhG (YjbR/CyaY superfamily)